MLKVSARWNGGFKFDGWDSEDRPMKMDASAGSGGEGDGFRPVELPLMGLAGCTGMDTIEILQKMRQSVRDLRSPSHRRRRTGIRQATTESTSSTWSGARASPVSRWTGP